MILYIPISTLTSSPVNVAPQLAPRFQWNDKVTPQSAIIQRCSGIMTKSHFHSTTQAIQYLCLYMYTVDVQYRKEHIEEKRTLLLQCSRWAIYEMRFGFRRIQETSLWNLQSRNIFISWCSFINCVVLFYVDFVLLKAYYY